MSKDFIENVAEHFFVDSSGMCTDKPICDITRADFGEEYERLSRIIDGNLKSAGIPETGELIAEQSAEIERVMFIKGFRCALALTGQEVAL